MNKTFSSTELQVWDNAAFDGDSYIPMKTSWSSSDCTKENLSPGALNSSLSKNDTKIDDEIAQIEKEIKRLTSKLEVLRLEKAKRSIAVVEKRGRVVSAKFMEPKQHAVVSVKFMEPKQNAVVFKEETPKPKVNCRRGMSLGPAEISGWIPLGKADIAAVTPAPASRRKSCFWKLHEIEEEKPKAKTAGVIGSRKCAKKKDEAMVQPKKLFKEGGDKSVNVNINGVSSNKKGMKQGRVVASRYNNQYSDGRKRSFPEGGSEIRMKKRWEIPNKSDESVVLLPKIKTFRCVNESPRDSGAAKRVAELNGKRNYFCPNEEEPICQVLDFEDDDAQEEEC